MAKKKTTEPVPEAEVTAEVEHPVGGIAAEDLEVLQGSIDERMAALLKDHQDMGVRPK